MPRSTDHAELGLRLSPDPGSVGTARDAVGRYADEVGADADEVKLAVSESVSNCVQHAFRDCPPGTISVRAHTEPGVLVVVVSDDGAGMSPRVDSTGLGLGIALITRVSHGVQIESTESGTTVSMTFLT